MKKIAVAFLLFTLFACEKDSVAPNELSDNPLLSAQDVAVHTTFLAHKSGLNTVGISIGIFKNGQASFYGYGETAKGSGIVPNQNTYYEIGSISKVYTAIAIVKMLEDEGKSIDTPIKAYLPANLPTLNRDGIELTFKHLLTHTSGLPYMPNNLGLSFYTNITKGWREYDENKLFSSLKNARLAFVPFTDFTYSNTAYGTLGVILQRKYGKDYGEIIKDLILEPLDLQATSAYFEETDLSNWAKGYTNTGKESDYWKTLNALDGAGVLKANASEVLKFAQANIDIQTSPISNSMALCQNIYTNFVRETAYERTVNCLGWFSYENKGISNETFLYHNGGTGGFNSELFINKDKNSALVILFNTDGDTGDRQLFIRELLQIISE
ncbi:MAG TPA: serine hydrolase domain-containing protein [Saprospiraceae bacterium]|nr:serine hydrolase domain-containing protein [Saprospiraceae bacterium]HMP24237.1 serine hydrolase domain-containing protein [Saprospiraceae bacterium]